MRKVVAFSVREIVVVILSGGIPLFLAFYMGGLTELEATLSGLVTPKLFLYYCAALVIPFAVLYFANKNIYIDPLSLKKKWIRFFISTLYELSSNIVRIFRVVSGVLIALLFLALAGEPESFAKFFISLFLYGVVAYIEVTIFYWWFSKLEVKNIF